MKLVKLTPDQIRILHYYLQDPSGTGNIADEWLTKNNLWRSYSNLIKKIEKLKEQEE